jgi:hypothetical protein
VFCCSLVLCCLLVLRCSLFQVPFYPMLFHYSSMFHCSLCKSIFPPFLFLQYVGDLTFNVGVWEEAWKRQTPSWWKQ